MGLRLTPPLARLLFSVHRAPGSQQSDLAARLDVTPATLGRMIDRLVKLKYVKRVPRSDDRRAVSVYVDKAGEPLVLQMENVVALSAARATRGMSERERATLVRLLARVGANFAAG